MARASGSCSACAMRSAASQAARPRSERIRILARPGLHVDPDVRRHELLGRGHVPVARSDNAVDARDRLGPERQRRDGLRTAEPEQPGHARGQGRRHYDRLRARTHGDDVGHAGHARGHGRHEQRRRQRMPPAGDVTAHAIQRADALLHADARRDADAQPARSFGAGDHRDVPGRRPERPAHLGRRPPRLGLPGVTRDLERAGQPVQPLRVPAEGPVAAATHGVHDAGRPRARCAIVDPGGRQQGLDARLVARSDDANRHVATPRSCSAGTRRSPGRRPLSGGG